MRKYRTLLLFLTSVVSLSLLIVYRNEYNRLHYVLEVFDFFGQPLCNFSDILRGDIILQQKDWGPQPTWQQIDDFYIYSAFLTSTSEVKAIALQSTKNEGSRLCYLWFEENEKPIIGKYRVTFLKENVAYHQWIYYYYCSFSASKGTPYAVSFVPRYKNKKTLQMTKILLGITVRPKSSFNITICASPTQFSKKLFFEFISFHKLLGVENFIFYLQDVPHKLSRFVSLFSSKLGIQVTFYNWNYPKKENNLSRFVVEKDCLLRTFGKTVNVIVLEIDELLVPLHSKSLPIMLSTYNSHRINGRLTFPVQKFCIENKNPHQPISVQNLKAIVDNSTVVHYMYTNIYNDSALVAQVIEDTAAIHKYVSCAQPPNKYYEDRRVRRFNKDLSRSTLVQMLIHKKI